MTKANVNEDGGFGKVLVEQHGDFLRETLKTALRLLMDAEVAGRWPDSVIAATGRFSGRIRTPSWTLCTSRSARAQDDERAASRRYFSLQSMELLKPTPVMMLEAVA